MDRFVSSRQNVTPAASPANPSSASQYGDCEPPTTDYTPPIWSHISALAPWSGHLHSTSTVHHVGNSSATAAASAPTSLSDRRGRRDRGPNWLTAEVLLLINAKKSESEHVDKQVDPRHHMISDAIKWKRVSTVIESSGISPCPRDPAACKAKWSLLTNDFKKLTDFFCRSGSSYADYCILSAGSRKTLGIPRVFPVEFFHALQPWFSGRAMMSPPPLRDSSNQADTNFGQAPTVFHTTPTTSTPARAPPHVPVVLLSDSDTHASEEASAWSNRKNKTATVDDVVVASPFTGPHPPVGSNYISLSSDNTSRREPGTEFGNTGKKRKHQSGHAVLADATKTSGQVVANQLKDMSFASRDLEQTRLQVQQFHFREQMEYQRDRDRMLQESSRQASDNAKRAIQKQSDMVHCLAQLASILSQGLLAKSSSCPQNEEDNVTRSPRGRSEDCPEGSG